MLDFSNFFRLGLFFFWLIFITPVAGHQNEVSSDPFAKFGEFTEESDLVIHHIVWSSILHDSVVVVHSSSRVMSKSSQPPSTGTKIRRGSRSAARFEGNRVMFHALNDDFREMVSKYRSELEVLPRYFPLSLFNKDEQLAYWLNLHNAILYDELAKRYPISKLKKLRKGDRKTPSLWDQKLVTIEGVPLSLNNIQNDILIRHWQTPMVLYGLYQGAIGGPSLLSQAFTGTNVHTLLTHSAKDFINSNRAMKSWGTQTKVSLIYDWGRSAFPNWDRDLARHFSEIGDVNRRTSIENTEKFEAKIYDWSITDTQGGTLSLGPRQNTAANLLTQGPNRLTQESTPSFIPRAGSPALSFVPDRAQIAVDSITNRLTGADSTRGALAGNKPGGYTAILSQLYRSNAITPGAYSAETVKLLRQIRENLLTSNEGTVTSYECGSDPCPEDNPLEVPDDDNEQ